MDLLARLEKIDSFIEGLLVDKVTVGSTESFENTYKTGHIHNNLKEYLMFLAKAHPTFMLVGEAPGYLGCGLTGIPFVDERQLKNQDNYDLIGHWDRIPENKDQNEMSASVIWSVLNQKEEGVKAIPLIWNAFPFHPFIDDKEDSNRKPNAAELKYGDKVRKELQNLFGIEDAHVYGIGRTAQERIGIDKNDIRAIRHPAYGGKSECVEQLARILEIERNNIGGTLTEK